MVRGDRFSHALTVRFPKAVDAFAIIDSDGSGSLSIKELAEGLTDLGIEIQEAALKELVDSTGLSTRSTIKYKDFLKLFLGKFTPITEEEKQAKALAEAQELLIRKICKPTGEIDHDDLLKAFQSFDDNGDGWIDNDELRKGFHAFGLGDIDDPNSKMAPFWKLISECDDNGDGKINYMEFLDLAGFGSGGRGDFNFRSTKGGGAMQGFRELNKFDAKILERERVKREMMGDHVEPDTPKGLMRWRAKYAKSFFGEKYITNMERAAKQLVADKAEGRYVDPVKPWSIDTRRYMEQVLKVPPEGDNLLLFKGIQTLDQEEDTGKWNSTTHDSQTRAFRTKGRSVTPSLARVDGMGGNQGNPIPGFLPGVHRQTGAFRQPMLLSSEWDEFKDQAVRSSLKLTHGDREVRPRYLHDPPFAAQQRGKTVKDVVRDYNEENQIDFSNTVSLRGPVDVNNPFSRFGGQWTLHDSVEGIIHKSHGDPTRPPVPTGMPCARAAKTCVVKSRLSQKKKNVAARMLVLQRLPYGGSSYFRVISLRAASPLARRCTTSASGSASS